MKIQFLFLLAIIITLFIVKYYLSPINNEPFDARVSGITQETCGTLCTETFGCGGFAFDSNTNKCYLSKYPVIQQPIEGLYLSEYDPAQFRCSKMYPIREESNISTISENDKKLNMFYACANDESNYYTPKKVIKDKIIDISVNEIEKIPYEDYELDFITWPVNKIDLKADDIVSNTAESLKKVYVFDKNKKEFLGQYLFPYKCVNNISEKECLDTCIKQNDCVGVEWNPALLTKNNDGSYNMSTNVCCPKRQIRETITRRNEHKNGFFYEKKLLKKLDKDIGYYVRINKYN
jgi:hypothetical protein